MPSERTEEEPTVCAAQPLKKAKYDCYYLEHYSFFLDVKIFFMTIGKVVRGEDTWEGVIPKKSKTIVPEEPGMEEKQKCLDKKN